MSSSLMLTHNGIDIPRTLEQFVHPDRTALVVYDMQVGIVPQVAEGPAVLGRVLILLEAARRARIRVVFTRHMSLPVEMLGSFGTRMAMAWQRTSNPAEISAPFLRGSPAFELTPELAPRPGEVIFDKLSMSAFEGTPLSFTLHDCGVRSFLIVGIALEIGIEPTCRHAADLGFVPILVRDACGAGNPDAADKCVATLEHMGDTILTDLATVTSLLSRSAR